MKKYILVYLLAELCVVGFSTTKAQTTLSGNHVIDGDLTVGTSLNGSRLSINGEIGNNAAPGLSLVGDGLVSFEGTVGPGGIPSIQGGATMIWVPRKAAFRAGYLDADSEILNIGNYSFGAGYNPRASGDKSVAFGGGMASGFGSFAAGERGAIAEGDNSFAINGGYGAGAGSVSLGGASTGQDSLSGPTAFTSGVASAAFSSGVSMGDHSMAATGGVTLGNYTTAISGGMAVGDYSFACGPWSNAYSYQSFVIGRFNRMDDCDSSTAWVSSDPLFIVGNGTGNFDDPENVQNRNAFVIYKSGDITIPKRQGDILMGEFGNPE